MSPQAERRLFPGWRWVVVAIAFPLSGYVGWVIGGPVDSVAAALLGGAITGAGLGAGQWWAADGAFGHPAAWIGSSSAGYAIGLAGGAALVDYGTDLGDLVLMGLISGGVLGAAQGFVPARDGNTRLAMAWGLAIPALFALGWWCAKSVVGVKVEEQFTVFGAGGAVLFMLLSGLVFARFAPARAPMPEARPS